MCPIPTLQGPEAITRHRCVATIPSKGWSMDNWDRNDKAIAVVATIDHRLDGRMSGMECHGMAKSGNKRRTIPLVWDWKTTSTMSFSN